jgi:hypothetical protein
MTTIINPLPNNIVDGDPVDANPVMANFNWIVSQVNTNAQALIVVPITAFTPALTFGGGATGMTFASQSGFYTRLGDTVFVTAAIVLTAKGSSTGNAQMTGLPLACNASWGGILNAEFSNLTFAGKYINAYIFPTLTSFIFHETVSGGANVIVDDTFFANNTAITVTGFYQV